MGIDERRPSPSLSSFPDTCLISLLACLPSASEMVFEPSIFVISVVGLETEETRGGGVGAAGALLVSFPMFSNPLILSLMLVLWAGTDGAVFVGDGGMLPLLFLSKIFIFSSILELDRLGGGGGFFSSSFSFSFSCCCPSCCWISLLITASNLPHSSSIESTPPPAPSGLALNWIGSLSVNGRSIFMCCLMISASSKVKVFFWSRVARLGVEAWDVERSSTMRVSAMLQVNT
mmetsp:Transcript_1822/g.3272  ORF Transcript_1822/g.3272 Transcript_1822/m.3272 type:complete len:232 (+) Transcript_1822:2802-3497(+)